MHNDNLHLLLLTIKYLQYSNVLLHILVIKIITINDRIRREQNRPPSSGLLLKYIVNCLYPLTQSTVNSAKKTDTLDTSGTQ
jgi:hypothetical protein